ncbi:DUF2177 family protein [Ferrovibrio sp.]|uniref:DUF2177 family protein n=1 Tax=Ferrovibrio sp. TaxID=1917215 RepID=UPI003D2BF40C
MTASPSRRLFLTATLTLLLLMAVADAIWLSLAAAAFYRPLLGERLNDMPVLWAAIGFYLLYAIGVAWFVLRPALAAGSARQAVQYGAGFGLVAYGTYDLTNQATLVGWPVMVTLVDMAWGSLLTASTAGLATWIALRRG